MPSGIYKHKPCSEETKEKISKTNRERYYPMRWKSGKEHQFYGKKHTKETLRKMSIAKKGKKLSEEHKKAIGGHVPWNKGLTKETNEIVKTSTRNAHKTMRENNLYGLKKGKHYPKCSEVKKGDNNPMWQGGKTPYNKKYHGTVQWRNWREKVFKRDNYTCQECNQRGRKLHPHHIVPVSKDPFPKSVFDVKNGQTLCIKCHGTKHKGIKKRK